MDLYYESDTRVEEMRVVQINCVYKKGSTGKIVADLHGYYQSNRVDSFVIYGRGKTVSDANVRKCGGEVASKGRNFFSRFTGLPYSFAYLNTFRIIRALKRMKPDVVHVHCINGYFVNIYQLFRYLKRNRVPTVITNHAEFYYTGSCGHALDCDRWRNPAGCSHCPYLREATGSYLIDRTGACFRKMKRAFEGFSPLTVTSVSPWLMNRAKESVILKDKRHVCVANGIDTTVFTCRMNPERYAFLKSRERPVVLFVMADFVPFKGSEYVIRLARQCPDINFAVVGNNKKITSPAENLYFVGRVENQAELAEFYSNADVTCLVSRKETFSMVCVESLCCGTPVVGFEAGAPETLIDYPYGLFCAYGDVDALIRNIQEMMRLHVGDKNAVSEMAQSKFSIERMAKGYLEVYKALCEGQGVDRE